MFYALVCLAIPAVAGGQNPGNPSQQPESVSNRILEAQNSGSIDKADELLTKGLSSFVDGDLSTMKEQFDQTLFLLPGYSRRSEMAPGYAAYGRQRLEADDLEGAAASYRRALHLGPQASDASSWRSQLAFITAEQRLRSGVADLEGYREALDLDPGNAAAAEAADRLRGAWLERHRSYRRWARIGAVLLLGLFALGLLYRRRLIEQEQGE